jgi:hypothetical protein
MNPTNAELMALWNVCKNFIEAARISCEEATSNDWVYEEAPNLVCDIANVVGYYQYEDEE